MTQICGVLPRARKLIIRCFCKKYLCFDGVNSHKFSLTWSRALLMLTTTVLFYPVSEVIKEPKVACGEVWYQHLRVS